MDNRAPKNNSSRLSISVQFRSLQYIVSLGHATVNARVRDVHVTTSRSSVFLLTTTKRQVDEEAHTHTHPIAYKQREDNYYGFEFHASDSLLLPEADGA